MTDFGFSGFAYFIDTELRIIHAHQGCPRLKMASKYGYQKYYHAHNKQQVAALDSMGRACHACWKHEQWRARVDKRQPMPGFMTEPKK